VSKSTIASLVVFGGLLAALLGLRLGEGASRGIRRLELGLEPASVERVVIRGKNPVELRRQGEGWQLADGRAADPGAVKQLLDSLGRLESSEVVAEGEARDAEYEVAGEKAQQVEIHAGGALAASFSVGKAAPGGVYLKAGGATYLVPKVFPYAFSRAPSGWYQLKLFDAKVEDARRLEVALAGEPAYALRQQDGVWALDGASPPGFRFDAGAGRALGMALVNARAIDLVLEPLAPEKTGLAGAVDRLAFVDAQGQRHALALGAATDKQDVYAQVEGSQDVLVLAKASAALLRKRLAELRDLRPMALAPDQVKRLRLEEGARRLVFERGQAGWGLLETSEPAPAGFELEPAAVERRLQALAQARAYALAPQGTRGRSSPERPTARVVAELAQGGEATLAFGARDKVQDREGVYARGNADAEVYMLDPATQRSLLGGLETFKKSVRPGPPPGRMPQGLEQLPPEVRAKLMQQLQGR